MVLLCSPFKDATIEGVNSSLSPAKPTSIRFFVACVQCEAACILLLCHH